MKTIEDLTREAAGAEGLRDLPWVATVFAPRLAALVAEQCAQIATEPRVARSWPFDGPATAGCAADAIRIAFPMPTTS